MAERRRVVTHGLATQAQPAIELWRLPAGARARLIASFGSAMAPGLMDGIVAWARLAKPRHQLLFRIAGPRGVVIQVARPSFARVWPWTVRIRGGFSTPSAVIPGGLAESLVAHGWVGHGARDGLWCHVAPGSPRELGVWLVSVLREALSER